MATAKAIVKDMSKGVLKTIDRRTTAATVPDLSDVQELRVKLIRQHHWLDPQIRDVLHRLGVKAATGELLVDDLEHAAEIVGAFKHTVPGAWRRDERSTQIA